MNATGSAWPGLEMRHLLALVAVVETGTFSEAAEQLGYTQSAVSQQVGTLERIVGAPLFERPGGRRPVRLTAAGEMLLTHARAVLARRQCRRRRPAGAGLGRTGSAAGRDTAERRHQGPAPPPGDLPHGMARHPDRAA